MSKRDQVKGRLLCTIVLLIAIGWLSNTNSYAAINCKEKSDCIYIPYEATSSEDDTNVNCWINQYVTIQLPPGGQPYYTGRAHSTDFCFKGYGREVGIGVPSGGTAGTYKRCKGTTDCDDDPALRNLEQSGKFTALIAIGPPDIEYPQNCVSLE